MPNGEPRSEDDLLVLLVMTAHGDVATTVKLEQLGFAALTFTEERKRALIDESARRFLPDFNDLDWTDERKAVQRGVIDRLSSLWKKVEDDRLRIAAEARRIGEAIQPFFARCLRCKRCSECCAAMTASECTSDLDLVCEHKDKIPDLHQLEGVARFFDNGGKLLLADDMGLGKTITALLILAVKENTFPALIVCPASVMFTWARTAKAWLHRLNIDVVVLSDPKTEKRFSPEMNRRCIVVTSYDRMLTLQRKFLLFKFNTVIFDESQLLLRWESQRTKGAVRTRNEAKYRMCLSGTPMPNGRHRELFGQVQILDETQWEDLEGYHGYLERYCDPKPMRLGNKGVVKFDGRSNEAELGRRLRRLILRRTKDQIGGLPEKTRYGISVPMTPSYRLRYAMAEDSVRERFKKKVEETRSELLAAGVLPQRVEAEVKKILSPMMMTITEDLRMTVGVMKAEWSLERVRDLVEEGHPVLVFAFHIEVAETAARLYRKEFGDSEVLFGTGQLGPKQRDDLVQKAQFGKAKVCVLTRAFSAGITLTRFYRGIMLERFWVPGEERQTEDRNYRRGQTKNVAWEYLLMDGTTDDHMGELQTWKEKGESQIHGSREVRLFELLNR